MDLRAVGGADVLARARRALGLDTWPSDAAVRHHTLAPAERRPIVEAEWTGTLIVIAAGELALHCARGGTRKFATDDVVWFTGLDLVAYSNPGDEMTELLSLHRPE